MAQKHEFQNGTLVKGTKDEDLRNPSCLIVSHTQMSKIGCKCSHISAGLYVVVWHVDLFVLVVEFMFCVVLC